MSPADLENLRALLERWGQEAWTPTSWPEAELFDAGLLAADVVYEDTILPDHAGESYHGHEGVARATSRWIEGNEWLLVELQEIVVAGDRLVSVHLVHAKAGYTGIEFETPVAYIWTFRDGQVVHFESHLDPAKAIEKAQLRDSQR